MKEVMRVLITETDNEAIEDISKALNISFSNMELITADTGKRCLDMVKDNGPDIVIIGDLADITDFDVIEQIRSCSEVPIMVLSTMCDESLVLKAFTSGTDGYITKPFHKLELIARIEAILRRRSIENTTSGIKKWSS